MSNWKKGIKKKSDFKILDLYKFYKSTNTNTVNNRTYSYIIKTLNKKIIQLIYDGLVFQIPSNVGYLGIVESKTHIIFKENGEVDVTKSNLSTDWGATNKLWDSKPELKHKKYIFHDNLHTDGRRFKIQWSRKFSNIPSLINYRFKPARAFQRDLTKYILKHPNKEYYEF